VVAALATDRIGGVAGNKAFLFPGYLDILPQRPTTQLRARSNATAVLNLRAWAILSARILEFGKTHALVKW
jgi:hypothetical protein